MNEKCKSSDSQCFQFQYQFSEMSLCCSLFRIVIDQSNWCVQSKQYYDFSGKIWKETKTQIICYRKTDPISHP